MVITIDGDVRFGAFFAVLALIFGLAHYQMDPSENVKLAVKYSSAGSGKYQAPIKDCLEQYFAASDPLFSFSACARKEIKKGWDAERAKKNTEWVAEEKQQNEQREKEMRKKAEIQREKLRDEFEKKRKER